VRRSPDASPLARGSVIAKSADLKPIAASENIGYRERALVGEWVNVSSMVILALGVKQEWSSAFVLADCVGCDTVIHGEGPNPS
jgi:hypothetical protein